MKDLHLILKKEWFDKIKSGEKKIEYRLATPFWEKRLWKKDFATITFQLGYSKNAPRIKKKWLKTELEILKHPFFG
ncbi:MAG: ASCH domain-containing protein, partial [Patescibacteria group bacterium]|nr:ASCH domain-containing protein [Patescibacteria group bacterium]